VKDNATVGGPNGHRSNGSEIEGRPDPRLETRVPDGVPDGRARQGSLTADMMNACQIYGSKSWCPTGCPTGAGRGSGRGLDGVPDGCPTGPDGRPDRGPDRVLDGVPDWARREPCHF
jgi:hypothetical protein